MYDSVKSDVKTAFEILMYFGSKLESLDNPCSQLDESLLKYINILKSPLILHNATLRDSIKTLMNILNKSKHLCSFDSKLIAPMTNDFIFDSNAKIIYGKSYRSFIQMTEIQPELFKNTNLPGKKLKKLIQTSQISKSLNERKSKTRVKKIVSNDDYTKNDYAKKLGVKVEDVKIFRIETKKFDIEKVMEISENPFKPNISCLDMKFVEGDQVLELNNISCNFMNLKDITNIIKNSKNELKIVILRSNYIGM
ncbi:hypothetical protein HZS_7657 [Henneguya salminicola]|nr:hypothetical protein HZS_7657 [Henneguya salminicola]